MNRLTSSCRSVALGLHTAQGILKRTDQNFATIVCRYLGLFDQRYRGDQSFYGTCIFARRSVRHSPSYSRWRDCPVTTHDFFELLLRQGWRSFGTVIRSWCTVRWLQQKMLIIIRNVRYLFKKQIKNDCFNFSKHDQTNCWKIKSKRTKSLPGRRVVRIRAV